VTRRAFTLLETVVVLVILGVLAAGVAPAVLRESVAREPLAASADTVARLLERARRAAVEGAGPVELTIDPARGWWWARGAGVDTGGGLGLHAGVRVVGGARLHARFDPRGPATGDAVELRAGVRTLTVRVEPWTAKAHVAGAR
jgi:prepilin-type N-terminal cleavage/methylation domain-containing protein